MTEGGKKRARQRSYVAVRPNSNVGTERSPLHDGCGVDPHLSNLLALGNRVPVGRGPERLGLWRQKKTVGVSSDLPPVTERSWANFPMHL